MECQFTREESGNLSRMMPVHILKSEHMIREITFKQFRKREADVRKNLKEARQKAGMTQKEVAEKLEISERYYRFIEAGTRGGDFETWDALEALFKIHQRLLRENSSN